MPAARPRIAVLDGPNLNLLGRRQPALYGRHTPADLRRLCQATADELGLDLAMNQSNAEADLLRHVHACHGKAAGLVLNPAGLGMTSIALADALAALDMPVVEVHITNMHRREDFRRHSHVAAVVTGTVSGLGIFGYALAIRAVAALLDQKGPPSA